MAQADPQAVKPGGLSEGGIAPGMSPLLDSIFSSSCLIFTGCAAPLGGTNSISGSGPLFQTYLDMAVKEDNSFVES